MFQNNSLCFVLGWLLLLDWHSVILIHNSSMERKLSQLENFEVCGWETTTTKTAEYIAICFRLLEFFFIYTTSIILSPCCRLRRLVCDAAAPLLLLVCGGATFLLVVLKYTI